MLKKIWDKIKPKTYLDLIIINIISIIVGLIALFKK